MLSITFFVSIHEDNCRGDRPAATADHTASGMVVFGAATTKGIPAVYNDCRVPEQRGE